MVEISDGRNEIQALIDPEHGTVSLAFLHAFGMQLIPDLLHSFRLKYPRINFQLHQDVANPVLDLLEAGEIDFCLSSPVVTRSGIQWAHLLTEELFVIVPKAHRLANRTSIKLNELAGDQFIFLRKGYTVRTLTEQYCNEAGFTPKVAFVSEEIATAAGLVTADLGVALLPNIKRLDTKKVSRLRVSQPKCRWIIGIGWIEGRYLSPAAGLFKQFVLDNIGRLKFS
jgi:DNA-binding transcriptional LysR family regulator